VAAAGAAGLYVHHKHEKEKEEQQRQQEGQSWVGEHKTAVGLGVAAAGAAGLYAHHEHEKHKREEEQRYKSEITHLEEKTNQLHFDDGRQPQFARTREQWVQEAQQRTDRFYESGPKGPTTWVLTRGPRIPKGAIEVSKENSWSLFSCRSFYEGGIQLGKASDSFPQGGVIGYGGEEIHLDTYEVLLGDMRGLRWVPVSGRLNLRSLGAQPVEGGRENDGTALFVAKAQYNGVSHPGKAGGNLEGANIPYGGTEQGVRDYHVLCYNN